MSRRLATALVSVLFVCGVVFASLSLLKPRKPPELPPAAVVHPALTRHLLFLIVDGLRYDIATNPERMPRFAAAMKQHAQTVRQAQAELRRLVLGEADEGAIQSKLAELQRLLADGAQMRVDRLKELTPILSPEQRQRLAELMSQPRRFHRGPRPQQG